MTPEPGVIVAGRYELERFLATGGMGTVWVARHLELDTPVAIKFMDVTMSDSEEWRTRFDREAKAAAALRSPHVVQVLDYGSDDDVRFIVMELLEGENLRQRMKRVKRMALRDASIIISQVCKAVALAAKKGITHRDLKPGNIFIMRVGDEEVVKVLDFGVAKDHREHVGVKTATGQLVGSPHYMSPEQARGVKHIDHRSDLWAVAVILYEMICGAKPFAGDVLGDLIIKIYTEEAPLPSTHAPELPPAVDTFFRRALQRDPDERFQSARELADEFAHVASELSGQPVPMPSIPSGPGSSSYPSVPIPTPDPSIEPINEGSRSLTAALLKKDTKPVTKRRTVWYTLLGIEVVAIGLAVALAGGGESDTESGSSPAAEPPAQSPAPAALSPSASASSNVETAPETAQDVEDELDE